MKPKAFIISLKRAKDRREHAIAQAEKAGLDWEIVDAVDGRAFRDADGIVDWDALMRVQEWDNSNWGCQFKASEIAIYASHLRVYQRMLNLDIPYAFVFEDDFCLKEAPYTLKDVWDEFESLWSTRPGHVQLHAEHLHFNSEYRCHGPYFQAKTLNRVRQTGLISVSYMASQDFASHFVHELSVMKMPHDHQVCALSRGTLMDFLQTSFPVCGSAGFASTQE